MQERENDVIINYKNTY